MNCILCGQDIKRDERGFVVGMVEPFPGADEDDAGRTVSIAVNGEGLHVSCLAIVMGRLGVRRGWFQGEGSAEKAG